MPNLLSTAASGMESTQEWEVGPGNTNTTVSLSTDQARTGAQSLKAVATASGTVFVRVKESAWVSITEGMTYNMSVWMRTTAASRFPSVLLRFSNSGNHFLGSFTAVVPSPPANTWVQAVVQGNAPAGATHARIDIELFGPLSAAEAFYVDDAEINGSIDPYQVLTTASTITYQGGGSNTASVACTTGVTVTKPTGLRDKDVMYAFVSKTNFSNTANFTCTGWVQVSTGTQGITTGNDRHITILRKVVTDASAEAASYTFVTTFATVCTLCATIIVLRGVDNTTPEDIAVPNPTFNSNDATPASQNTAGSATANAMALTYCQLSLATVALRTWGVPSGYSGDPGVLDCGLVANSLNNQQGVAYKTLGAVASTPGTNVWTHTADEATAENTVNTILVRPATSYKSFLAQSTRGRSIRALLVR